MDKIQEMITSIDLNNVLKIFDIQIAVAVALMFILFRGVFSSIIIKIYYLIVKKNKKPKESSVYKYFSVLFVFIGVYLSINILPTNRKLKSIMTQLFEAALILFITKCLTTITHEDSYIYKKIFKKDNKTVNTFISKIIRGVMWVISFFVISFRLGFGKDLSGLFTALGIFSAALALAAQEIVKSLIGGMEILTDKPFVIGDWIEVGEHQGTVIDITYRSTRLKSPNNAIVTIPNSVITAESIINWNRLTSRRFETTLNLSLETTSEKVKKIVKEIKLVLENNKSVVKDSVQVHVSEIATSSINIFIYMYVKETEYTKFLRVKEELLCTLLFLAEKENIDLAYPTQTLYLRKGEEDFK